MCSSCRIMRQRHELKRRAVAYKGGKCEVCGYNKCIEALVFHHRNPSEKEFHLGVGTVFAWEKIRNEVDKCMLLCCNCHTEVHVELRGKD